MTSKLIGSRLKRNIFTNNGSFLLSANTVLKDEHVEKLQQHKILLTDDDIVSPVAQAEERLINTSLYKIKEFFQAANFTKTIPLNDIQKNIIPTISHVSKSKSIFNLVNDLQEKDDYTYTHNLAVSALASTVGKWLKISGDELQTLTLAALLHDIGKTKLSSTLLSKRDNYTPKELAEIKSHTILGFDIIQNTSGASERIALVALQHHEREDGSGYPKGLKADEIDYFSKIIAVCDVFHEKISLEQKPYHQVLKEMWNESFGKLDASVMTIFIRKTMDNTLGSNVELSNGQTGKIVMINQFDPIYPMIKLDSGEVLDLNYNRDVYIEKIH